MIRELIVAHVQDSPAPPGRLFRISLSRFEGADVAFGGRRFAEPQHSGAFPVGELLEVPQRHDFAVERVHAVEGLFQPDLPLGPDGRLAGPGIVTEKLRGQSGGGCLGHSTACRSRSPARHREHVPQDACDAGPEVPAPSGTGARGKGASAPARGGSRAGGGWPPGTPPGSRRRGRPAPGAAGPAAARPSAAAGRGAQPGPPPRMHGPAAGSSPAAGCCRRQRVVPVPLFPFPLDCAQAAFRDKPVPIFPDPASPEAVATRSFDNCTMTTERVTLWNWSSRPKHRWTAVEAELS